MDKNDRFASRLEKIEALKSENENLRAENKNLREQLDTRRKGEEEYYKMLEEVKALRDSYREKIKELGRIKQGFYQDLQGMLDQIMTIK